MISLREGTFRDIPVIIDLARKTWPTTYGHILTTAQIDYMLGLFYSPDFLKLDLDERKHVFLIAENPEPIAFAAIGHHYNGSDATKIFKLYVLPEMQGLGIGNSLLKEASRLAAGVGDKKLMLNVNRQNKALKFYERLGFNVVAEEDIDIGNGYFMNDYIMELNLPQQR